MLVELDPATAAKIHPNNVRYVARALEVVMQTGPREPRKAKPIYQVFKMAIDWPRRFYTTVLINELMIRLISGS